MHAHAHTHTRTRTRARTHTHTHTLIPFSFCLVLRHRIGKSCGTAPEMSGGSARLPCPDMDESLGGKRAQHLMSVAVSPGLLRAFCVPEDSAGVFTESS